MSSIESAMSEAPPAVAMGPSYRPALTQVPEPARTLLEKWSGIAPESIAKHVNDLRDRAYKVYPYASIGLFTFLDLDLPLCPDYPEVLQRVKNGQLFLDLGCCFAQEVRLLISDGAPPQNVYGADLSATFIDMGYELFLDKLKLGARFITDDIFSPESILAAEFTNRLHIVHASNFFHLWNWDRQVEAAKLVVKLLAPEPGSMIIGSQVGSKRARALELPVSKDPLFIQSLKTFRLLWEQVGRETGVKFEVTVEEHRFSEQDAYAWPEELEAFRMIFVVRRT
ncbi:uncharacterized protein N7498_001862 [Penicillium cinerascens]|uniref:Methyltransferase domain-containing protein n=1 Tax=Penicillium cinerascens TaxID=70096 RepID=A0A9W9N8X8_9EURO|nr:uncharacterized protein N7498_001862 [Penicillium cinerascens]KAJ5215455.1 hypothetical protein N7498_001862 [Penicillium cinerascens]